MTIEEHRFTSQVRETTCRTKSGCQPKKSQWMNTVKLGSTFVWYVAKLLVWQFSHMFIETRVLSPMLLRDKMIRKTPKMLKLKLTLTESSTFSRTSRSETMLAVIFNYYNECLATLNADGVYTVVDRNGEAFFSDSSILRIRWLDLKTLKIGVWLPDPGFRHQTVGKRL